MIHWFGEYKVYSYKHGWIVHNTKKDFKDGHTHMSERSGAIGLVRNVQKQKVPKDADSYYLTSLMRLSKDDGYRARVGAELFRRQAYKEKMQAIQLEGFQNEIKCRGKGDTAGP